MDPRYKNPEIFSRRKDEWNPDQIQIYVNQLFSKIELLEDWKFVGSEWVKGQKSKRAEELKRHILSLIRVTVKDTMDREIVYDIQVPDLVEDHFFYIGGYLKVPIFQIFDYPIIFRNNLLKLRTNTITVSLDLSKNEDSQKLLIFNKLVPLDLLLSVLHTKEELDGFIQEREESPILSMIAENCYRKWDTADLDTRILELGEYFSNANTDKNKKGYSAIFSLKTAYEVDFFSTNFFKTSSILFEVLNALYEGPKSDTDITRKRIRFAEYILSPLIRKVYDLLLTLYNSKKVKFQISQSILVDGCNAGNPVSDIVHFNFPINPASEVASLCQATLTGPGGFKKDNVPSHLRDLDPSQLGRICPADTPDRDGCGVILNMIPTVKLDKDGNFLEGNPEVVSSYPISIVPFLEHDDQVRLQMASNQLKQSILLRETSKPLIKSGIESAYLEHTTFFHKAKNNGVVVHVDVGLMIVVYDDKTSDVFRISYRNMYLNTIDYITPKFAEGERFNKDDILCHSLTIQDGELALGQNLLTGVAIWKGYNYEDAIVLSDAIANKKFTSLHYVDLTFTIEPGQVLLSLSSDKYQPIPKVGQHLKKGDVCAKIKTLDGDDGFESINIEPFEVSAPIDCTITDIEIYPNTWNKKVKEFDQFINELAIKQSDRYITLYNKLRRYLDKELVERFVIINGLSKLDCTNRAGRYSFKGQKIGGVIIKLQAIYEEAIGIGDKIANRHGNKGVISKIIPENMMPTLEDGRKLEIIINPLGIISRMNVGQLYELHLNEALFQLKQKMIILSPLERVSYLQGFLDIIDKTPEKWVSKKIMYDYLKATGDEAINSIYLIQPPFKSIGPDELFEAMEYTGASFKYKVFDPANNMDIKNPISVGRMYFLKLVHRATDKMSARSIGPYSKKTLQPLGGRSKQGGHRLGEMEAWSIIAHGANNLIEDFLTVQSDSPGLKNRFLAGILQNPDLAASDRSDLMPQSLRLLESNLKILGLIIKRKEGVE